MSLEKVRTYLEPFGLAERIQTFDVSSATVELAAAALHCEPCRIAKTLSFMVGDTPILIVAAGDAKVDNPRYKAQFGTKARMLTKDEALEKTGHAVGGVCPFAVPQNVRIYLDVSLRRFETVFPAAGSANSAIELTLPELETASKAAGWIDVCKAWRDSEQQ
ncbi:MAG: YbaK/EbsC family protein [Clostridia bacterium]|nr:YbaK/EbsC family protein [Clostridia bacterium]